MERKVRLEVDGVKYRLVKAADGHPCEHCAVRFECKKQVFFCDDQFDYYWSMEDAAEDDVGVLQGNSVYERQSKEAMED